MHLSCGLQLLSVLRYSSPLITASITHLFLKNDRFNIRKFISLVIGVAGIIFIVAGRQSLGAGHADIKGVILLILSIIFSAAGNILVSEGKKKIHPVLLNSAQLILGGILLVIVSCIFEGIPVLKPDIVFISVLLYLSFISAAAFSIWFHLLNIPEVKVSELNMWKFLIPVFGAVFSWIILPGEVPTPVLVTGMIVISVSIFFYFRK